MTSCLNWGKSGLQTSFCDRTKMNHLVEINPGGVFCNLFSSMQNFNQKGCLGKISYSAVFFHSTYIHLISNWIHFQNGVRILREIVLRLDQNYPAPETPCHKEFFFLKNLKLIANGWKSLYLLLLLCFYLANIVWLYSVEHRRIFK